MPGALRKIARLITARGVTSIAGATLAAAADACWVERFTVKPAATAVGQRTWRCTSRKVWCRPTMRRLALSLRRRLGLPLPDSRRRATVTHAIDEALPDVLPVATLLLAGSRALADDRVRQFLRLQAASGNLHVTYPDAFEMPHTPCLTLLTGVEPDEDGQNCLLNLRARGIACEWLAASSSVVAEEVPLRESCMRQATPTEDGGGLDYTAIDVPRREGLHQYVAPVRRSLRVLTYRWHVPHQYELFKLGAEFTLITDLGESSCGWWDLGQRPLPANARFARWRDIDPRCYDFAILHFDENVFRAAPDAQTIGADWGKTFRFLLRNIAIPRIAVCHGAPHVTNARQGETAEFASPLVDALADTVVVVNSYQAQAEWAFRKSRVIWHGFDPEEFPLRTGPANTPGRILTLPQNALAERPLHRSTHLLEEVTARLKEPIAKLCVPEPNLLLKGNAYARAKFAHYVAALHRFDIYFNPTLHSPMPRSRGEAMLCGLATVNANSHDTDRFIDNGVNGFYSVAAEELAEQLQFLAADPARASRIGLAGRDTAVQYFHIDRYLADWRRLIREVLGGDAA